MILIGHSKILDGFLSHFQMFDTRTVSGSLGSMAVLDIYIPWLNSSLFQLNELPLNKTISHIANDCSFRVETDFT